MKLYCKFFTATILLLSGGAAMSIEQPSYNVVFAADGIEYRQYEPYLVAETLMEDITSYSAAGNEGFRRLFRYISGANGGNRKIAMTAPVAQSPAWGEKINMTGSLTQTLSTQGWSLAFMLPSEYTVDTVPQPTDPRVRVRRVPVRTVAVLRYNGRWTETNRVAAEIDLRSKLADANVEIIGAVDSAMFNSPFMLPLFRRNEIHAPIDRIPAAVPTVGLVAEK